MSQTPRDGKPKIAVIGSGISGAACAWLLRDTAKVQLFEIDSRFGGHTHSYKVAENDREFAIDTGFMVYNHHNYPLLCELFTSLGIQSYPTDMSFSVSLNQGQLEYAGTTLGSLFAQKSNLFRASHWRMLRDIMRFNRLSQELLRYPDSDKLSLNEWLDLHRFSESFRLNYLFPMAAAIWSSPRDAIGDFPILRFVKFFDNHGLNRIMNRPQWYTVEGGSSTYMAKLIADLGEAAKAACGVKTVVRENSGIRLRFDHGEDEFFDQVVFACHSDQALKLLHSEDSRQRALLRAVPYQNNQVWLHRDTALMPKRRSVWASWNYLGMPASDGGGVSVSYWMNSLQRLAGRENYFVSLNPEREPDSRQVIAQFDYAHPLYDQRSFGLQNKLKLVQGKAGIWFAGAWTGYGFHEDGLRSAVEVAQALGAKVPWAKALEQSRHLLADSHQHRPLQWAT